MTVAALQTELLFVPGPKAALTMGRPARGALARLLDRRRPRAVAVVGYCGGLHADLAPGTLLLADRTLCEGDTVRVGASALARARDLLPAARVGPLVTVDRLAPPAEKVQLGLDALGVDMESFHLARELFRRQIPFLVARVVLDPLWEGIPSGIQRLRWAGRAVRGSWILGRTAPRLHQALDEAR